MDEASTQPVVTFSTRPLTMGELEMCFKIGRQDTTAIIDIIVARSDPKVTREYVCSLPVPTVAACMADLAKSLDTVAYIEKLFGQLGRH